MESSPKAQVEPMGAIPSAGSSMHALLHLYSPSPGLQALQGAYTTNVLRLEQSAERMSESGSDIAEEIRWMNEAEKERTRSRNSSLQSSRQGELREKTAARPSANTSVAIGGRSRNASTSSYSNSIRDVNNSARWGGYSPAGYVTSPAASVYSGSYSHASTRRTSSGSRPSRLAQMLEPTQERRPLHSPLISPTASSFPQHQEQQSSPRQASREASQSSFAKKYDQIAGDIAGQLMNAPPSLPKHESLPAQHGAENDNTVRMQDFFPGRPRSADTFQQAEDAFEDFDGVHFSPTNEEFVHVDENANEVRRVSARDSSGQLSIAATSMLRAPEARPITYVAPPPDDGMVYYPAPVPRTLNLPKRLSKLPAASVQAKRRTQLLSQLPQEARQSAPWIPSLDFEEQPQQSRLSSSQSSETPIETLLPPQRMNLNPRMGKQDLAKLPPQLRASFFFDHQSVPHDVEVKSESAVATLDSILAASVTAPVNAFTYHPFAGNVAKTVYAHERRRDDTRMSTATLMITPDVEKKVKKQRSSLASMLKRSSSGDQLSKMERRNSRGSVMTDFNEGGNKLQKRKSQMSVGGDVEQLPRRESQLSLADELEQQARPGSQLMDDAASAHLTIGDVPAGPDQDRVASSSRPATALGENGGQDAIDDDLDAEEQRDDVEDDEAGYARPTTLLAELQIRKAQQKSRNRTAATSFPNGMHSTLLELDAVAQIEKKNRKSVRVALAWEDPDQRARELENDEDDEVPLAMLYPGNGGKLNRRTGVTSDWDRPVGLIEQREMEDNEPLSSRRNRLRGISPSRARAPSPDKRATALPLNASNLHLVGQPHAPVDDALVEDENEGETLGQRLKRLKTKTVLDNALGDVMPREGSRPFSTFADDVLSQLGGLDVKETNDGKFVAVKSTAAPTSAEAPAPQEEREEEEEETLGQRRARLLREAEARIVSDASQQRPPLTQSSSITNLPAANPVGSRQASRAHEPAEGTLLHASAQVKEQQRRQLLSMNQRSSSHALDRPLVHAPARRAPVQVDLLGQQQQGTEFPGALASGTYNGGAGMQMQYQPQPMQTSASAPMFGPQQQQGNSYFAPATMPLGYSSSMSVNALNAMSYPHMQQQQPQQQQQMMNPLAYHALTARAPVAMPPAYRMSAGFAYPPQHLNVQMPGVMGSMRPVGVEDPQDSRQRAMIDRWRMSIAQ